MAANQLRAPQVLGFFPPNPSVGAATKAMSAAATWLAFGFVPDQSRTLARVRVFPSAVAGTLGAADLSLDVYSDASGVPGASLVTTTTLTAAIAANTWAEFGGASTGLNLALTAGTQYWIVLKNLNATPGTNFPTYRWIDKQSMPSVADGGTIGYGWIKRETANSGTSWTTGPANAAGGWRLEYTDGTFDGFPCSNIATSTDPAYGVHEAGVRFVMPTGCAAKARGAAFWINSNGTPTGNPRYRLYEGASTTPTLIGTTYSVPRANVAAGGTGYYAAYFPSSLTLTPGQTYRLTIANDAADSASNYYRSSAEYAIDNDANSKALMPFVGTLQKTATTDGVTFADSDTAVHPFALLLDTSGPFASAGGGGGGIVYG